MPYSYVASPYSSRDPFVMEGRYYKAMLYCANALKLKQFVYSPIVHCHAMARIHNLPTNAAFWEDYNKAMLASADALIVLQLRDWQQSVGVAMEIAYANELKKPIIAVLNDSPMLQDDIPALA